jgi:hypothetical protein
LRHDDRYTLLFGGELDLASASSVEELTRELCVDGAREIVLDLSGLAFIDSVGVKNVERLYELDGLVDKLPWAPPGLWSDSEPAFGPRGALRLVSSRAQRYWI